MTVSSVESEDGIRDSSVTGVQACALPISNSSCTGEGKAEKRRDPSEKAGCLVPWMRTVTRLSCVMSAIIGRGRSQARTQHGPGGQHAGFEISPQGHHQRTRHVPDRDATYAP